MKSYTDNQLLDRVKSLPTFKGWPKDKLDIWVRAKVNIPNAFDDKCYSYDCTTGIPIFKGVNQGTSHAGRLGLQHYEKYGLKGCAVLKSDVIVYESHAYGLHKGKYPAYIQVKGFPYFRDSDRDDQPDEDGQEYNNIIGANCHHAGIDSVIIEDWSIACMVRNILSQFNKWMVYMNRKPLTVCILKEF